MKKDEMGLVPPKAPITTRHDIACVVILLDELESLKKTYRELGRCGKKPSLETRDGFEIGEEAAHCSVQLPDWVVSQIRQMIADRISTVDQMLIQDWGLIHHVTYGWS